MCGFVVALGNKSVSNEVISKMTDVIHHRGPDKTGFIRFDHKAGDIKIEDNIRNISDDYSLFSAAGFKRLSIRDKSDNGNQPMVSQNNNSFICFNGEIYNTDFLRNKLSKKSYKLRGSSDTEIILEYFLEFGIEDLSRSLEGMYGIFLYDSLNKEIFILRDRFGIKPLYFSNFKGNIIIASEIKSILEHPEFKFSVNYDCLDEFLKFRYITAPLTLIKGVNQLNPGSVTRIDKNLKIFEKSNIWEDDINFSQNSISLKKIIQKSIAMNLLSDVEVGLQLSGGIDSSLITSFADSITPKNYSLKTFSIIFDDSKYSEEYWISRAIKNTNTKNFLRKISNDQFVNILEKVSYHLEHPINHPNTIGIYYLANLTNEKGIKVLLSGEGADELFAGYPRFLYIYLRNNKIFKFIVEKINFIENIFINKLKTKSRNIKDQVIESTSKNNDIKLKNIFKNYSRNRALKNRRNIYINIRENNHFKKHRKYEVQTYLQSLLVRQDKMNMAFGVENRVPFLSKEVFQAALSDRFSKLDFLYIFKAIIFIFANPKSIVDVFTKLPLKKEALNIFEGGFTFRKKSGFAFPISDYMKSDKFVYYVENKLFNILDKTPLSKKEIINIWNNFLINNDDEDQELLWTIFMFLIWLDVFQN